MLIVYLYWLSFVLVLLALAAVSIYVSLSGRLVGRVYIGWLLLGTYALIVAVFVHTWVYRWNEVHYFLFLPIRDWVQYEDSFFVLFFLTILILLQVPLAVEIVSLTIMGDPSKGLKLLTRYNEAERRENRGDLAGAISEYQGILQSDRRDTTARFRLATLYFRTGQYREAASSYETILSRPKKLSTEQYCSARMKLAEIYGQHLEDIEKARGCLQAIIERLPNTQYARYANERLRDLSGPGSKSRRQIKNARIRS